MIYRSFAIEDRNRCHMGDKNEQHREQIWNDVREWKGSGREGAAMLKDVRKGGWSEKTRYRWLERLWRYLLVP